MLTQTFSVSLGYADADSFLDCAADLLDSSGFVDLEREPARILAKQVWPSGSTLDSLSFFHSAVIEVRGSNAFIELGTSRSFVFVVFGVFAVSLAGFWWFPPAVRVGAAVAAGVTIYVGATLLALARAKAALASIVRQCAGRP